MKENKYDDPVFFEKYNRMSRSTEGLAGAGEWETLRPLLPDFTDKTVLDLGCGLGWHAAYARKGGTRKVIGVDLSERMLEKARKINAMDGIEYRRAAYDADRLRTARGGMRKV